MPIHLSDVCCVLQPGGSGWVWACSSSPGSSSTLPAGCAMRTSAVSLSNPRPARPWTPTPAHLMPCLHCMLAYFIWARLSLLSVSQKVFVVLYLLSMSTCLGVTECLVEALMTPHSLGLTGNAQGLRGSNCSKILNYVSQFVSNEEVSQRTVM